MLVRHMQFQFVWLLGMVDKLLVILPGCHYAKVTMPDLYRLCCQSSASASFTFVSFALLRTDRYIQSMVSLHVCFICKGALFLAQIIPHNTNSL